MQAWVRLHSLSSFQSVALSSSSWKQVTRGEIVYGQFLHLEGMDHLPVGKPSLHEEGFPFWWGRMHTLYQGGEESLGCQVEVVEGRRKSWRLSPGILRAGLPRHLCLVSTPASVQTWPHPSSIAEYPRQPSGRAGRCAPCPATGRGTPHRTRAGGGKQRERG